MDLGPRSPLKAKDRSNSRARQGRERSRAAALSARRSTARRRRRAALVLGLVAAALAALAIAPLGNDAARAGGSSATPAALVQQAKLTGNGEEAGGRLGSSAALSADGSTLIVGAPKDGHGAAYVYTRNGSTWEQQGSKLSAGEAPGGEGGEATSEECAEEAPEPGEAANECAFGTSVALSADGNTAIVGDPSATAAPGAAWVYTRTGATWTHSATLVGEETANEGRFGRSVALSADGNTALVGDPSGFNERGAGWVFAREGSTWTREAPLKDEEESVVAHLGRSVALSGDGATALLGAPGDSSYTGAAWVFTFGGGAWTQESGKFGKLVGEGAGPGTHFGKAVALSGDGGTALVGAQDAEGGRGAVWAFERTSTSFAQQGSELKAHEGEGSETPESEGRFGASLALSGDGTRALVGAPHDRQGVGRVTQLTRSGGVWSRLPEALAGREATAKSWMGTSVALSGDGTIAAIGASRDNKQNGAAWVFEPQATIPPPVVESVKPPRGPTTGGTEVTIAGGNFNGASEVHFGATAVAVTPLGPTEIVTTTPPGAAGRVDVTVTTPSGTSAKVSKDGFVYEEPGTSGEKGSENGTEEETTTTTTSGGGKTSSGSPQGSGGLATGGVQAFIASAGSCNVSVAKKRLAVTRYRTVALRLVRSGAGPCSGSVAISYRIKGTGRGYALRTIGTASFSIAPGASRVITVKLSKAGQKWLRAHRGKGNASLAIARVVPAPTVARSASVRLSLKKARKATPVKH